MKANFKVTNGTQGSKCAPQEIPGVYEGEMGSRKANMWVVSCQLACMQLSGAVSQNTALSH